MVFEKAGIYPLGTYTDRRKAKVSYWVTLRPILDICDRYTGYGGGVSIVEANGGQKAAKLYVKKDFVSGKRAALEIRKA